MDLGFFFGLGDILEGLTGLPSIDFLAGCGLMVAYCSFFAVLSGIGSARLLASSFLEAELLSFEEVSFFSGEAKASLDESSFLSAFIVFYLVPADFLVPELARETVKEACFLTGESPLGWIGGTIFFVEAMIPLAFVALMLSLEGEAVSCLAYEAVFLSGDSFMDWGKTVEVVWYLAISFLNGEPKVLGTW